ncbi:MAG: hypothetical protein ACI9DF_005858 [Verrucomicrobiales bacterium]
MAFSVVKFDPVLLDAAYPHRQVDKIMNIIKKYADGTVFISFRRGVLGGRTWHDDQKWDLEWDVFIAFRRGVLGGQKKIDHKRSHRAKQGCLHCLSSGCVRWTNTLKPSELIEKGRSSLPFVGVC